MVAALGVYVLIFSGSVVVGARATAACLGWPLCNGDIIPQNIAQTINLTHRYLAAAVGVLLFYVLSDTLRAHRAIRPLRRAAHTAIGLFALQILGGGINVLSVFHPAWNALHLALATAVWGSLVVFSLIAWQTLRGQVGD